jgi:hypothetical protein
VSLLLVAIDTPPSVAGVPDNERSFMAFKRAPHSGAWKGFSLIGSFPADDLLKRVISGVAASNVEVLVAKHELVHDTHGLLWTKQHQAFVPDDETLRADIIESTHATILGGHYGVNRTVKKLQECFFWPGMHADVIRH